MDWGRSPLTSPGQFHPLSRNYNTSLGSLLGSQVLYHILQPPWHPFDLASLIQSEVSVLFTFQVWRGGYSPSSVAPGQQTLGIRGFVLITSLTGRDTTQRSAPRWLGQHSGSGPSNHLQRLPPNQTSTVWLGLALTLDTSVHRSSLWRDILSHPHHTLFLSKYPTHSLQNSNHHHLFPIT